jgi:EpsI family protein
MTAAPGIVPRALLAPRIAVGLSALLLLGTGWGHRWLLARIDGALAEVVRPVRPLASLPLELGEWRGTDVPLDARVLRVAHFDDDYVNRAYYSSRLGRSLGVFIGYIGRPRAMLGHRPDECYAAHGWEQLSQESVATPTLDGRTIPGTLYQFRAPQGGGDTALVLATYVVNGCYVRDPAALQRYNSRSPNLFEAQSSYQARIQVLVHNSGDRAADLAALQDFMTIAQRPVSMLMPYWNE